MMLGSAVGCALEFPPRFQILDRLEVQVEEIQIISLKLQSGTKWQFPLISNMLMPITIVIVQHFIFSLNKIIYNETYFTNDVNSTH